MLSLGGGGLIHLLPWSLSTMGSGKRFTPCMKAQNTRSCGRMSSHRGLSSSNGTKNNGKKMRRLIEPIEVLTPTW